MPMVSTHRIQLRPSHGMFSLRDVDADAGLGSTEAINAAHRDIAAGTGYEVWVRRAQDMLLVDVEVQTWDSTPDGPPADHDWQGPLTFPIEFPTGELYLADLSETSLPVFAAPAGPGTYTLQVFHTGRREAVEAYHALIDTVDRMPLPDQLPYLDQHARGIERYLLRLWPGSPATR